MPTDTYHFYGDRRLPTDPASDAYKRPEPYRPEQKLIKAVNLAIHLKRPLLLEGEAGSGKSRLAHAVAYELGLPLYTWTIRSTSKANDGLYTYDAILRLYDVQTNQVGGKVARDPSDATLYRHFGALGKAFSLQNYPAVVLIDEIDKADLDFPNDLLTVLEPPREFEVSETLEQVTAKFAPIVIITSNKEKGNLPAPFLRRCIYYYLQFPSDPADLKEIIDMHLEGELGRKPDTDAEITLVNKAVSLFLKIRATPLQKRPSTSELLDWVKALLSFDGGEGIPFVADKLPDEPSRWDPLESTCRHASLSIL